MNKSITRRQFVGSSLAVGGAASATATTWSDAACAAEGADSAKVLAQDHSIVFRVPSPDHYLWDHGLAILPSGDLFVISPCSEWKDKGKPRDTRKWRTVQSVELLLARSGDGGRTWRQLPSLPYDNATPIVHDGKLYLLVPFEKKNVVLIQRSDDGGESWTEPVQLFEGHYWNCPTGMAVLNGQLYWAMGPNHRSVAAIAAELSMDLMNPKAWRMSPIVTIPPTPDSLTRRLYPPEDGKWPVQWGDDYLMEGNVVAVNGQLRVIMRAVIDEYATAGMAAICDLEDDGKTLDLQFSQFHPWPGGQVKFFVVHDQPSRFFWMASNLPTDAQDLFQRREKLVEIGYHGGAGNERRILMLHYSTNALNWFPAGCIAMSSNPLHAFSYPCIAVAGDDLVVASRTSQAAPNQHDSDLITLHRVRNFRSLALDVFPRL